MGSLDHIALVIDLRILFAMTREDISRKLQLVIVVEIVNTI